MKRIETGNGTIPVMTLLAIWSISLVVNLPGLAIGPMMGMLDKIFPHATDLEIQLLGLLPNFFIFPFILLSGKLSLSDNKSRLVALGLSIFLAGGIVCFFAHSLAVLIAASCVIGVGCGLVIPLAAGMLAENFSGEHRVSQLGIKSGLANITLVIATLVVGGLAAKDWHLPFTVYLVPIIPLLLIGFISKSHFADNHISKDVPDKADEPAANKASTKAPMRRILSIALFYLCTTICSITLCFFIPFLMQRHGMTDFETGLVSATFYLLLTLPGFFLPKVIKLWGRHTMPISCALMVLGLLLIAFVPSLWSYFAGAALTGFGYGTMQPVFYNKAAILAPDAHHSTQMLSYVMSANYLGIAVCPLIFADISDMTAFIVSGAIMLVWLVLSLLMPRYFLFSVSDE